MVQRASQRRTILLNMDLAKFPDLGRSRDVAECFTNMNNGLGWNLSTMKTRHDSPGLQSQYPGCGSRRIKSSSSSKATKLV